MKYRISLSIDYLEMARLNKNKILSVTKPMFHILEYEILLDIEYFGI